MLGAGGIAFLPAPNGYEDFMSAENAQREPTMEEILASIRRIISEEDKPADGGDVLNLQPPAPPPVAEAKQPITPPKPAPQPAPPPMPEPVVAKPPPIEMFDEPEPPPPPRRPPEDEIVIMERLPEPAPAPAARAPEPEWTPPAPQRPLVSDPVASQTAGALGRLMGSMMVSTGNTLDDVVRELLKPMLKEWLDANLSQLVEAEVAKEIDRIRRMSR
jgi:cell pole-organizing protein PopZ